MTSAAVMRVALDELGWPAWAINLWLEVWP